MFKKTVWLILILVAAILVGSCSQQIQTPIQEPITGLDDGSVKVIREDVGPSRGGFLNLFMVYPDTLNPLTTQSDYVIQLSRFVFDSLFYEDEEGGMEEGLVKSYSFSQDGLILDLELKENILCHDGTKLSADDVVFSLETIKKAGKKSLYINHISNIVSINALNRLSLRIVFNKADDNFIKKLSFPVLPEHVFKDWPVEGHSGTMKLVGSGPFIFDSYLGNEIKLLRNDSWWVFNEPEGLLYPIWIDGIIFKLYSDDEEMMQAFQRQQIDIAWLEEGELESYSKRADIFFNKYESNLLEFLVLSPVGNTDSPFSQEGFRSVIVQYLKWYAENNPINSGKSVIEYLNYDSQNLITDKETALESILNQGFYYDVEDDYVYYYKNAYKKPLTLSIHYNSINTDRQSISQWISKALSDIGIQVIQEAATFDKQQELVKSGKFDMMLLGCSIPVYTEDYETMELVKDSLNVSGYNHVIVPLYRKNGAVLYHNYIRGARKPFWKNIYNGWDDWYLVHTQQ